MSRRILLRYDGSDLDERAFKHCLRLAAESGGQLAIVGVIRPSEAAIDFGVQTVLDQAHDQVAAQLTRLERRARLAGIEMFPMIRFGDPVRETVRAAEEWHADLIVTCAEARGILPRLSIGATARRLLARARCEVHVVR